MILGHIIGKTTTKEFKFAVEGAAKKFQYVQFLHEDNCVLAQITEIERDAHQTTAHCRIIGYRDDYKLKTLKTPPVPSIEILEAEQEIIKSVLGLIASKNSAFFGTLEGYTGINVNLDLNKILTKHLAILAKSGSGKSYACSVLLEELMDRKIPLLIIDPHGEYSTLKYPNIQDKETLEKYNLKPKGYIKEIHEYSPDTIVNTDCKPLKLSMRDLTPNELIHLLPAKLSNAQLGCLYSSLKELDIIDFDSLILQLEQEENNAKWTLIHILEYVKKSNIFSTSPTLPSELIQPGRATIINLKGIPEEVSQVVVYKLVKDLFNERKKGNVPPFFLVLEESHNFIPERSFGESKSSGILRQIFAEGRKFGLGACLISQRPSRVEKNALSQVTTQIILKVTNPNDLKAISNSVEGITSDTEKEIQNIPIGTAMVVGVVDTPLFVNVRTRKTKHGGEAVTMLDKESDNEESTDFLDAQENYEEGELLSLIKPSISLEDKKIMSDNKEISTTLIPCTFLTCKDEEDEFYILINNNKMELITDSETAEGIPIRVSTLPQLSSQQKKIFSLSLKLNKFKPAELFAKSGLQFSDLFDIVNVLASKGFLEKDGDAYSIAPKLSQFRTLNNHACYAKPDFAKIHYDKKLEKHENADKVVEFLGNFIEIIDIKECFLVLYE